MARVLRQLGHGEQPHAPGLSVPGWWRRPSRLLGTPAAGRCFELPAGPRAPGDPQPLLIVGDDGPLTHLAVRACEVRGLHYTLNVADLDRDLATIRPWAVLDTRDREGLAGPRRRRNDGHGARSSVARVCADAGLPCALFTSAFGPGLAAEALSLPGLLVARTGPVFVPWDAAAGPAAWLDRLDEGRPVRAEANRRWRGVYGPDLLDGVLDLLLDGAAGGFDFIPREALGEAQLARELAAVADGDPALVSEHRTAGHGPVDVHHGVSYAPPTETTLERFVRERRLARSEGERAVHRREDDVRLEQAH
jgi:dTDP-4-dehydrorhamnose reductase